MTTPLDTLVPPQVTAVLVTYGATGILRVFSSGAYDPTTGGYTEGSATDSAVKLIPPYPVEESLIDGETYQAEDMWTGITGENATEPNIDNSIFIPTAAGTEYKIMGRKKIRSGDSVALYVLHIRELKS